MNLSKPFVQRPIATVLLTLGLALAGIAAFFVLPVSPLPQVDYPTISVSASLPGASPETMASSVATPLERRLGTIAGVYLFLVCHRADVQRRAIEAVVKAVESGRIPRARIDEANRRLDTLAARFAHPPAASSGHALAMLGSAAHRSLAEGLGNAVAGVDPTETWLHRV